MKRIVIIGGGFAGLAAAKALRHSNADILVIDRANHNLFQPLLYQVAATVLSPSQIASPIRGLLKNQRNTTVFLGEVSGINKDAKIVYAMSTSTTRVAARLIRRNSAFSLVRTSTARDEASSTPVGPAPTKTKVSKSCERVASKVVIWTAGVGLRLPANG
jgi:NADH dehydrogenase FAD-containing subunit